MTPGSHLRSVARLSALAAGTAVIYVLYRSAGWLHPRPTAARERLQGLWARGVLRLLRATLRVSGAPPEPPFFLVSNHLSYLDIVVLYSQVPCSFVAKSEVARWPAIGRLARMAGHLFVDRQRSASLPETLAGMREKLAIGTGVAVFPEATTSPGGEVLPFPLVFLPSRGRNGLPGALRQPLLPHGRRGRLLRRTRSAGGGTWALSATCTD